MRNKLEKPSGNSNETDEEESDQGSDIDVTGTDRSSVDQSDNEIENEEVESDCSSEHDHSNQSEDDEVETDENENEAAQNNPRDRLSPMNASKTILLCCFTLVISALMWSAINGRPYLKLDTASPSDSNLRIYFEHIDKISDEHPQVISPKEVRLIKARFQVMKTEVSILMLLGKARDKNCLDDSAFCIVRKIANSTNLGFNYLDALDPGLNSARINLELTSSLDRKFGQPIVIESLEKLPANQVINLFQFIDKDELYGRKGMLIFVVYTSTSAYEEANKNLKDAEIVERVLSHSWSANIPKDTLTSIISRMCGSVVKLY